MTTRILHVYPDSEFGRKPSVAIELKGVNDPGYEWSRVSISWAFPSPRAWGDVTCHTLEAVRLYTRLARQHQIVNRDQVVVTEP